MATGIVDGQPVDAAASNAAWIAKNGDDATNGILGLKKTDLVSGPFVNNAQQNINSLNTATECSSSDATVATKYSDYFPNERVTDGDSHKKAIAELDRAFANTALAGGHNHDGTPGNGAPLGPSAFGPAPLMSAFFTVGPQNVNIGNTSNNVSTLFTGFTAQSSSTTAGVSVFAPQNICVIRALFSGTDPVGSPIYDAYGNVVYGRLTFGGGIWTLSYFTYVLGAETAYTFSAFTTIRIWAQELFDPLNPGFTNPPPTHDPRSQDVLSTLFASTAPSIQTTVRVDVANAMGSTNGTINTKITRFNALATAVGGITYADSATLGGSFTINEVGVYSMNVAWPVTAFQVGKVGMSRNTTQPTTDIDAIPVGERLMMASCVAQPTPQVLSCGWTGRLNIGDVIRVHDNGNVNPNDSTLSFTISKVAF